MILDRTDMFIFSYIIEVKYKAIFHPKGGGGGGGGGWSWGRGRNGGRGALVIHFYIGCTFKMKLVIHHSF